MSKSIFEEEMEEVARNISMTAFILDSSLKEALESEDVLGILSITPLFIRYLDGFHDFLIKYSKFFELLEMRFGIDVTVSKSLRKTIGDMKNELQQIMKFASLNKFDFTRNIYEEFCEKLENLKSDTGILSAISYRIDYSKLSNKDWRMVGLAGIHYRSKVFLSYPFRDDDPKKDENQRMIDYSIKPLLKYLDIIPVTARDYLKPQELIDDKIIDLVTDCDGIIGFYTENDDTSNVEHELPHTNIIAICREEGAKMPSMRFSRLMINFNRETRMGDLLLGLIEALKDKELFRLKI